MLTLHQLRGLPNSWKLRFDLVEPLKKGRCIRSLHRRWMEQGTGAGKTFVAIDIGHIGGTYGTTPYGVSHMSHCPRCGLQVGNAAPPPPSAIGENRDFFLPMAIRDGHTNNAGSFEFYELMLFPTKRLFGVSQSP